MTSRGRIGVVGTNATLRSNAFGKAIHNIRADVQVYGNPCPLLVHLVENGLVQQENPITRLTVQMYLEPLMKEQIDTLILGCTHYPLLYDIFNELLDYQVTLIDPGRCAAGSVRDLLMSWHSGSGRASPNTMSPMKQNPSTGPPPSFWENRSKELSTASSWARQGRKGRRIVRWKLQRI